jgi:hypothetical protein
MATTYEEVTESPETHIVLNLFISLINCNSFFWVHLAYERIRSIHHCTNFSTHDAGSMDDIHGIIDAADLQ